MIDARRVARETPHFEIWSRRLFRLPLHHGVEAANENLALVAHPGNRIEGLEDHGAGASRGAEETCPLIEMCDNASSPKLRGHVAAKAREQSLREPRISSAIGSDLLVEDHSYSSSSSASAPRRYLMS